MIGNRYGKVLTILLIVLIIAIVIGLCFLGYGVYKRNKEDKSIQLAVSNFDYQVPDKEEKNTNNVSVDPIELVDDSANNTTQITQKKVMYEDFVMLGTIEISKTNVSLPILEEENQSALNKGACLLYKTANGVNESGNIVLISHNYKNGKLFSNNKKLSLGDKINIKDTSGKRISYTIYQIFETTPEDTSFYNRDTNGVPEITLSTCTDDGTARLIILAKSN